MSVNGVDSGWPIFLILFFFRVKKGQHGITVSWYYRPDQVGEVFYSLQ